MANSASGQQNTNRMHHKIKPTNEFIDDSQLRINIQRPLSEPVCPKAFFLNPKGSFF